MFYFLESIVCKHAHTLFFSIFVLKNKICFNFKVLGLALPKGNTINGSVEEFNLKYSKRSVLSGYSAVIVSKILYFSHALRFQIEFSLLEKECVKFKY